MPTPIDIQFGGSGSDLAAIDKNGNLTLKGAATVGSYVALPAQANAPTQVPGEALLYSPDGASISLVTAAGPGAIVSNPAQVLSSVVTVTGTTAKTPLLTGPTIPANGLTAGMAWHIVAWGSVTTTVDTQTVLFEVDYGSTQVFTWAAQQPNSSATVTGAAWKLEIDMVVQSPTSITASGWDGLDYFFSSLNQQTAAVVSTTAQTFTLQVTNSANAVSLGCAGAYFQRIA